MKDYSDYPLGAANDPFAPYNEGLGKKIKVHIDLEVSKEIELQVDDDFDESDMVALSEEVMGQVEFPKGWEMEDIRVTTE